MAINPVNTYSCTKLQPAISDVPAPTLSVRLPRSKTFAAGTVMGMYSAAAASEVQSLAITGTPTGGTFTLTYDGKTTSALPYNATPAQVQAALEALSNIGTGNVLCAGGPLPGTAISITFRQDLAQQNVPAITTTDSLTGGTTPASAITTSTAGSGGPGMWDAYDDGASNGLQVARGILVNGVTTDAFGRVILGDTNPGENNNQNFTAEVYVGGFFNTALLTGLDANGISDMGRLVYGTAAAGIIKI